ncbi:MAG TPA: hypothetical protein VHE79_16260, partial [Spirochaetia bacterium]
YHRFFGTLEAIQGNDRIWITNGRFSVAADLRGVRVYLIPDDDGADGRPVDARGSSSPGLGSVPWSRIFSLPEGTPVFVAGTFVSEEGRGVFKDDPRGKLLVVIHDCPRESVMRQAISGGRQRNEYINSLTLPSVGIGSLSLILLAFTLLSAGERLLAVTALTAGLGPLLPFLPPGFPLYFAYRSFWKKARLLRVQRDILRLPLGYFPGPDEGANGMRATLLPDLEPYLMVRGRELEGADALLCGDARLGLPEGIQRIGVTLPRRRAVRAAEGAAPSVVCAGYTVTDDQVVLKKPDDPLAAFVLIPGDPASLSEESAGAARWHTIVSGFFISLNVAVNVPLVFLLLTLLIR